MSDMAVVDRIVEVETRSIRPYGRNPRKNSATVDKLVELIPKVGFNVPLVLDRQNVIVKGHTRWRAAIRLGYTTLPCVYTDADPETIKLDRLADNRVQEFSTWNTEMLQAELGDLAKLGFSQELGLLSFAYQPPTDSTPEPMPEFTPLEPEGPDMNDYVEVTCAGCGHTMFIPRAEVA